MTKFNLFMQMLLSKTAANPFYSGGKIYVVVAVLLIIFLGIVFYLIRLERKINKLEDKDNEA